MQATAFWVVESLGPVALQYFNGANLPEVFLAYHPESPVLPQHVPASVPGILKRDAGSNGSAIPEHFYQWDTAEETLTPEPVDQRTASDKSAITAPIEPQVHHNETTHIPFQPRAINMDNNGAWYLSMDSFPPNLNFDEDFLPEHEPSNGKAASVWDDSFGQDQTIYVMEIAMDQTNSVSLFTSQCFLRVRPCFFAKC
jgi:hypothetical protein